MKDKSGQPDKDVPESSTTLKTAGPGGEITAGLCTNILNLGLKTVKYIFLPL